MKTIAVGLIGGFAIPVLVASVLVAFLWLAGL